MKTTKSNKAPTIKDIASACGVSTATVSYVLNGKSVLREDTRERIFQTMREMNYHPNALARGLHTKSMHTLGIMLGTVDPIAFIVDPYTCRILQGVIQEARRQKFQVTLFTDDWKSANISGPCVRDGRTDGILVIAPVLDVDIMDTLPGMQPNLVTISAPPRPYVDNVDVDDYMGGRIAVEHLIQLGHRRIAYLTGNTDLMSYKPRLAGFLDCIATAGIPHEPNLVQVSHFNGSLAAEQTAALLNMPNPPTAIFAGNDAIAINVIAAAVALGRNVPRDLSVIGFDNIPAASMITPLLTTINQPVVEIGSAATVMLIERIVTSEQNGAPRLPGRTVLLEPNIIVRGTTAPPLNCT